ncbi:MAG: hypothetical protein QOF15_3495 [Mycobacterium sp.]|jgi:hypothetical protein|nr:hypothetical protein [Mycobacterium sp.]
MMRRIDTHHYADIDTDTRAAIDRGTALALFARFK